MSVKRSFFATEPRMREEIWEQRVKCPRVSSIKHLIRGLAFHCILLLIVLLQQKPVKPGLYSVIRWHISPVCLPL